jgi:hypothetical protein
VALYGAAVKDHSAFCIPLLDELLLLHKYTAGLTFRAGGPEITGRQCDSDRSPGPSHKAPGASARGCFQHENENEKWSRTSARTRRGVASANEKKEKRKKRNKVPALYEYRYT